MYGGLSTGVWYVMAVDDSKHEIWCQDCQLPSNVTGALFDFIEQSCDNFEEFMSSLWGDKVTF
jgi:uncharacterized protein YbdZ (MbtH family)